VLLNYRANASAVEPSSGQTAMTAAFSGTAVDVARLLLKFGGNPDAQDRSGKSARAVAKNKDLQQLLGLYDDAGAEAFEVCMLDRFVM
jgi:ankyrin repeat protein